MTFLKWLIAPFMKSQYEITTLDSFQMFVEIMLLFGIVFGIFILIVWLRSR